MATVVKGSQSLSAANAPAAPGLGEDIPSRYEKLIKDKADLLYLYHNHYINAQQYNAKLRNMYDGPLQQRIAQQGEFWGGLAQIKDDWLQAWDNLKRQRQLRGKEADIETQRKAAIKAGQPPPDTLHETPQSFIDELWSTFSQFLSFATVPGQIGAKRMESAAASIGAPPWMQKLLGVATDATIQFALTAKPGVEIQSAIGTAVGKARQAIKGAKEVKAVAEAMPAVESEAKIAFSKAIDGELFQDVEKEVGTATKAGSFADALKNYEQASAAEAMGTEGRVRPRSVTAQGAASIEKPSLQQLTTGVRAPEIAERKLRRSGSIVEYIRDELKPLAEKLVAGDTSVGEAFDLTGSLIGKAVAKNEGIETMTGRASDIINALKSNGFLNDVHSLYAEFAPEMALTGDWEGARKIFAQRLLDLTTEARIQNFFDNYASIATAPGDLKQKGDLVRAAYVNVLIAKPATWVKKIFGDTYNALDQTMVSSFAGLFSKDKIKGALASEGPLTAQTMFQAMLHNLGYSSEKFANVSSKELAGFFDTKIDPAKWAIPSRAFDTITSFYQRTGYLTGMYRSAYREALQKGLTDSGEISSFVAARMEHSTVDMLAESAELAHDITSTNDLGNFGLWARNVMQAGPLWYVNPFAKIPMNLTNRSFSNVPGLNLLSRGLVDDLAAGGLKADYARGRLAWAQWQSEFFWLGAKEGLWTGGGPSDPKENSVWRKMGYRPYSFMINNQDGSKTAIPYGFAHPVGMTIGVVSDLATNADYMERTELEPILTSMVLSVIKNAANVTWWEFLRRAGETIADASRGGLQKMFSILAETLTTPAEALQGGPVMRTIMDAIDPTAKNQSEALARLQAGGPLRKGLPADIPNIIQSTLSKIAPTEDIQAIRDSYQEFLKNHPMLAKGVPTRVNPLTGKDEVLPTPWGASWITSLLLGGEQGLGGLAPTIGRAIGGLATPGASITTLPDPVMAEIQKVGATIPSFNVVRGASVPGGSKTGELIVGENAPVKLDWNQQADWMRTYGTIILGAENEGKGLTVYERLAETIKDPDYQASPMPLKAIRLDRLMSSYLAPSFNDFLDKNPDVKGAMDDNKDERILRFFLPADRELMKQQLATDRQQLQQDLMPAEPGTDLGHPQTSFPVEFQSAPSSETPSP